MTHVRRDLGSPNWGEVRGFCRVLDDVLARVPPVADPGRGVSVGLRRDISRRQCVIES